ncbi:ArsR family transcriptional regulator [Cohaesibacter sp. ES.047]|uniref:metalloregulator ArsR/SmtB family transcription factor n=1 Tax=Cohaesibacter sp. ES.047 TaxID=1798205 RepID=UPI000BB8480F|nr:metalloregulator ArsR/SmtB family transcription factor [Cohaesibacter sp. ES.047]SNY90885.1 ArsR family transcriptional regulator [Cohaesibacter sp. ES.047]
MQQTKFFQCLSDETRLRALLLFEDERELCVCELSHALDQQQPKISRHMAAMREAGIVSSERKAQWVFYSLNKTMPVWQKEILVAAIRGNKDDPQTIKDKKRLANMTGRPERNAVA